MIEVTNFLKGKSEEVTKRMGLEAEASVSTDDDRVMVELKARDEEDTPLLIGFHGQTLNSLQTILRTMAFRAFGEVPSVLVEVGDYRRNREEEITRRALEAADKTRFLLKEVSFPAMSAYERRIIHIALSGEKGVRTESRGEGRERHVVVVPEGQGRD
ncbi:KH domain-containing protein [Candidatus Saccharibacteria bacterium]|nr:KH domain-containing protein [Candidatus Saccharibacteria bacterium]